MNGEDQGPNLSDFNPSWMEDGLGFTGEQGEQDFSNQQQWDTNAWSRQNQDQGDAFSQLGCIGQAGNPPPSGTHVLGSVDGTCQWIDTTTCP